MENLSKTHDHLHTCNSAWHGNNTQGMSFNYNRTNDISCMANYIYLFL